MSKKMIRLIHFINFFFFLQLFIYNCQLIIELLQKNNTPILT
jgi:hypothetical protein